MLKKSWWVPIVTGATNVGLNVFVMLLANSAISPSLVYPTIGVGSLCVVTLFSLFVFKDRMRWWQWVGVAVGMLAVVLLSL